MTTGAHEVTRAQPVTVARRSPLALVGLVALVLVPAALFHVWVHLQVIAVGYELSRETRLRHDLSEANQRLRLELATRLDPALVEKSARERLGLNPPDARAIRMIGRP
jgi:cell division protein FtsL